LSVSIGTCGITDFSKFLNVFIDYNKDGDFTDAGERVYSSSAASTLPQDEIGSILIPNSASIGTTRMRVMLQEGGTSSSSASGTYTYGETEDYSITITGTPNKSYSWTVVGNPAVISTAQTFPVTPTETTVYRVTVTDNSINCTNYTDVTVVVNSNPINPLSGGATSICLGTPTIPAVIDFNSVDALLVPTAGLIWTSSNEAVATIDNDGVLTPLTAGTTTIGAYIFNSSTGCTTYSPNTIVVNVYNPIVKTSDPTSQTILPGTNTSFTVTATGSNVQYQWYSSNNNTIFTTPVVNNAIISGAGTNELVITGATLAMNGTYYRCAITGSSPCTSPVYSEPVLLSVQNLSITNPVSQSICNTTNTASFSVTTAGPTPDYFIWEYNDGTGWVTIEDQSQLAGNISFGGDVFSNTLVLNDIILTNTTWQFRANAVIESTGDIATSSPATLTVSQSATITNTPTNKMVCYSGETTSFAVTANNATGFQWQFSTVGGNNDADWTTITNASAASPVGVTYTGTTSATLGLTTTSSLVASGTYFYRVVVSSASPCNPAKSASYQLQVKTPVVAIASTPANAIYCAPGTGVTLEASGTATYSWNTSPVQNTASIVVTPSVSTTYTVTGSDATGCSKTAQITVNVASAITALASASPQSVCTNGLVQLTATPSFIVNPYSPNIGSYVFENTTDAFSSIVGGVGTTALTLTPTGSFTDDAISAALTIPFTFKFGGVDFTTYKMNSNGWIQLGATSTSGSNYSSLSGTDNNIIAVFSKDLDSGLDYAASYYSQTVGTSPNRITKIEWTSIKGYSTGNPASGIAQIWLYEGSNKVELRYGAFTNTSTSTSTVQVGLRGASTTAADVRSLSNVGSWSSPTLGTSSGSTVAIGTLATPLLPDSGRVYRFSPNVDTNTYSYAWTATAGTTVSNAAIASPTSNPAVATTYTVKVSSSSGCSAPDASTTVLVESNALITNQPAVTSVTKCAGESTSFGITAVGPNLQYQWYKGTLSSPVSGATSPTLAFAATTVADTGSYFVVVTPACGTIATSNTVVLTVNPLPTATIAGTATVCTSASSPSVTLTGANGTAPYTFTYKLNGVTQPTVQSNGAGVTILTAPIAATGTFVYELVSVSDSSATACSQTQAGSATITVIQGPSLVTVNPSTSTICANGNAVLLTATTSDILAQGTSQVGTSTTTGSTVPISSCWGYSYTQSIYPASLLTAQGITAGTTLKSLSYNVTTTIADGTSNSWDIYVGNTTQTSFTSTTNWVASGSLTQVYSGNVSLSATGWVTITFATPFVWNGTNLVIATDENQANFTCSASFQRSTGATNSSIVYRSDSVNPLPSAPPAASTRATDLPNIRLGWEKLSSPAITWSPTTGLFTNSSMATNYTGGASTTVFARPTTTTTYTAKATTANGCFRETTALVNVNPIPLATIAGTTSVCNFSASPTITFTGSNGTAPYTFTYNAPGAPNQTVVSNALGVATITAPTGTVGTLTYTLLSVQDSSSTTCLNAQSGSVNITVNPLPTATIAGSIAVCQNDTAPLVTFTGANGTSPYTFTYTLTGVAGNQTVTTALGQDSVTVAAPTGTAGTFVYSLVSVQDSSSSTCSNAQSGNVTIIVHPTPTAVAPANQAYYSGFPTAAISLTGTPSGVRFNITGGAAAGLADVYDVSEIPSFIPTTAPATVTITPVANGCTGLSVTYQVTGVPVVANITSSQCGSVNNGLNNQIQAGNVSVPGYITTGYRFEVTNTATGEVAYVDTVQSMFKLTDTSIYAYGTTFTIRVAVYLNNNLQGFFGNTCSLTTASVQTTKVVTAQCGATLAALNSTINVNSVGSTNLYRFRVALATAPTTYYLLSRPVPNFNLSMVPGLPLTFDTEYKVDVQIRVKLAGFEAWSQYGAVCSVFTPAAPTTSVTLADCEMVATSLTQTIHIVSYPGATMYRVRLTRYDELGEVVIYEQTVDNVNPSFTLSQFSGLEVDTNYTVDVSMELFGSFTPYGKQCSVVTPGAFKATMATTFKAVAYPNPFANNFMIDVKSSSESAVNLKVYDMIGRLVEQRDVRVSDLETSTIGERYPSGVYNVVVSQDESVQTVRVVKR
jgi:hypothetical protein